MRTEIIEQRVMSRLRQLHEAGKKKSASKGEWSGLGTPSGAVWNRHDPKPRRRPSSQQLGDGTAASKWSSMSHEDRAAFMASAMDGFSRSDREEMAALDWRDLVDELGGNDSSDVTDLRRNLRSWS